MLTLRILTVKPADCWAVYRNCQVQHAIPECDKLGICARIDSAAEFGCPLDHQVAGICSRRTDRLPVRAIIRRQVSQLVVKDSRNA